MRYVEVQGARVSVIGLGTAQFGSLRWGYGAEYAEHQAVALVHRALDLGINLIDTAESYGLGRSERIVGRAVRERRHQAFLATKLFPEAPLAPMVERRARHSAERLGVDTIDLYQVHRHNPVVPAGTVMEGMRRLQRAGTVRHVGVSNYSVAQWQAAEEALGAPVLGNQVEYSLAARRAEVELLPYAGDHDRLLIAWSPLSQGLLTGKYDVGNRPQRGVRAVNPLFLPENLLAAAELLGEIRSVASAHDATAAQVALAWLVRRTNVVAIPGASSVGQLELNAAAADLELSDDDDLRLTEASDRFRPRRGARSLPQVVRTRLGR